MEIEDGSEYLVPLDSNEFIRAIEDEQPVVDDQAYGIRARYDCLVEFSMRLCPLTCSHIHVRVPAS